MDELCPMWPGSGGAMALWRRRGCGLEPLRAVPCEARVAGGGLRPRVRRAKWRAPGRCRSLLLAPGGERNCGSRFRRARASLSRGPDLGDRALADAGLIGAGTAR
ncbi:hypothetical protein NDU88_004546 [Pleurodeles waltl]|uniref:Uncharacterized protein n=1 Tax=Pleurodeles waltl TaxID=8319 RepID=A0AAV7MTU9_PLEWA|nr:hypothetical protein NDU88_004546 [Pleurodeles waltl]